MPTYSNLCLYQVTRSYESKQVMWLSVGAGRVFKVTGQEAW